MQNALFGRTILDLTDEKGGFCTQLLAGMGAKVIKIDPLGEQPPADPTAIYNLTGKSRITLDITRPEGAELFERLALKSDILVESLTPGYLASIGLGYETLSAINPGLIMASITDFGQTGPYRDYKSSNLVSSSLSGQVFVNGEPGQPPLEMAGNQAYKTAGLFAVVSIMLAVLHQRQTSKGQHIDIAAMECAAGTLDQVMVRYFNQAVISQRQGGSSWNHAFEVLKCRDGYILITLFQNWETLVELLVAENMAGDLGEGKWGDAAVRLANAEHIKTVVERWTMTHHVSELVEMGQLIRLAWAPVNSPAEVLENQQLASRGFFRDLAIGDKVYRVPGSPLTGDYTAPLEIHNRAEDNFKFYGEMGLNEAEIDNLSKKGII